jgi:hypothetical protein
MEILLHREGRVLVPFDRSDDAEASHFNTEIETSGAREQRYGDQLVSHDDKMPCGDDESGALRAIVARWGPISFGWS